MTPQTVPLPEYDPSGFRRLVARLLDLGRPASRQAAEQLIDTRLGPYRLDGGMVKEEINSYFTRH